MTLTLNKKRHLKFFERCLAILPTDYEKLDTNRMTVLFFAILGLDILGELETVVDHNRRLAIIAWVYSLQVLSPKKEEKNKKNITDKTKNAPENEFQWNGSLVSLGFRSSPGNGAELSKASYLTKSFKNGCRDKIEKSQEHNKKELKKMCGTEKDNRFDSSHITMTYNALAILLMLKDDFSGVDRFGILEGLKELQGQDGCFGPMAEGGERDMRFVFCAASIYYILCGYEGKSFNVNSTIDFIRNSLSFEGAFGMNPGAEAHGGSTFCALASLKLLGRLHGTLAPDEIENLKRWLLSRQASGFNGRSNKPVDCCYSFWVGASLKLLDSLNLADKSSNENFTLSCQNPIIGGFSKWPDCHPDALHATMGLAGLSLLENERYPDSKPQPTLNPIYPGLTITNSAHEHLKDIQSAWKSYN